MGEPPASERSLIKRAALGALAIVLMTAGAVSAAGLMEISRLQRLFLPDGKASLAVSVDVPDPGKPQTLMVLGTDGRLGADAGGGQRSDTIILARLDADSRAITLTSVPRDLLVTIPGHLSPEKINAAYEEGGADLTLKTVKDLLSRPGEPFQINHVVEVNFTGFRRLVDYLGCTYIDVDRHYFNDVGGPGGYATIDIDAGYQKLCGDDALDYVRYRHGDSDLIRSARQQDFIRQTLRQPSVKRRLTFAKRTQLVRLAGRFVRTDPGLGKSAKQILSLLKLGLGVKDKPIQQVPFGAGQLQFTEDLGSLTVSPEALATTVDRFLHPAKPKRSKPKKQPVAGDLTDSRAAGEAQAGQAPGDIGIRLYYPTVGLAGSRYSEAPRVYTLHGQPAYRMSVAVDGHLGAYYGIQGMAWQDPPILDGPHEDVLVDGRTLSVYDDGRKVRLVAWKTPNAVYYVENTLDRLLTRDQMLAIMRSVTILPSSG